MTRKEMLLQRRIRQRNRKAGFTPVPRTSPKWSIISLRERMKAEGN